MFDTESTLEKEMTTEEALLEVVLSGYPVAMRTPEKVEEVVENLLRQWGSQFSEFIEAHSPESESYVESRDWAWNDRTISVLVFNLATHKPQALRHAARFTDFEDLIVSMAHSVRKFAK